MAASGKNLPGDTLRLRITVVEPPPGILWALQSGLDGIVPATAQTKSRITFDFTVEVAPDAPAGAVRLRGPAVQGKPGGRFVYLRMGSYAGQDLASGWRAKISLEGISRKLLDAALAKRSTVLEARFAGTAKNGGPACASVPLLGDGWTVA